jgi:hypothetical protein
VSGEHDTGISTKKRHGRNAVLASKVDQEGLRPFKQLNPEKLFNHPEAGWSFPGYRVRRLTCRQYFEQENDAIIVTQYAQRRRSSVGERAYSVQITAFLGSTNCHAEL